MVRDSIFHTHTHTHTHTHETHMNSNYSRDTHTKTHTDVHAHTRTQVSAHERATKTNSGCNHVLGACWELGHQGLDALVDGTVNTTAEALVRAHGHEQLGRVLLGVDLDASLLRENWKGCDEGGGRMRKRERQTEERRDIKRRRMVEGGRAGGSRRLVR
jgi:hypothetical protein